MLIIFGVVIVICSLVSTVAMIINTEKKLKRVIVIVLIPIVFVAGLVVWLKLTSTGWVIDLLASLVVGIYFAINWLVQTLEYFNEKRKRKKAEIEKCKNEGTLYIPRKSILTTIMLAQLGFVLMTIISSFFLDRLNQDQSNQFIIFAIISGIYFLGVVLVVIYRRLPSDSENKD
ncbi:MAG: hypothetical protein WCQ41_05550 [Bacillota bacterium]